VASAESVTGPGAPFGALLRRYRAAAGLTQEALAERAGISWRAISNLERGLSRAPQRGTAARLAEALSLPASARERLLDAARSGAAWPGAITPSRPGRPRHAEQPPAPSGAGGPLVGRTAELSLLERHLAGAGAPLLLLAGIPGIGKSRLLREAAALADGTGWAALAGGCTRGEGQEPFTPLPRSLQRHLTGLPVERQRRALEGCAWLVRLLPELAGSPIEPLPGWTPSTGQERRLMFEAVGRFLANVAQEAPGAHGTLLLLDDLQWVGADALDLLATLVRGADGHLRIVGAYREGEVRPGHPLEALVADLTPAGLVRRHVVGPLAQEDAALLLDALATDPREDAGWREAVLARAGGVPFYLRSFALASASTQDAGVVPWDIAQSIRWRVAALPGAAREVLALAAVAGRTAPRTLLLATATQPAAVTAALDAACHAALLRETDADGYAFVHDVIRDVVEADMGRARRVALHQQIARSLERTAGMTPVEALAYHYAQAGEWEQAARYLEQAGDRAVARHANAAAEGCFRELLGYLDAQGRASAAALVQEKLGILYRTMGHYEAALAALDRAAETYLVAGDLERLGQVAEAIGDVHAYRGTTEAGIARLRPLAALLEPRGPTLGIAAVYSTLAHLYFVECREVEGLAAADRMMEIARALGDERRIAQALGRRSAILTRMVDGFEEWEEAAAACLAAGEQAGDPEGLVWALEDVGETHNRRGRFELAWLYFDRALRLANQQGHTNQIANLLVSSVYLVAFFRGDWARARAALERTLEIERQAEVSWLSTLARVRLADLDRLEGRQTPAGGESRAPLSDGAPLGVRRVEQIGLAEGELFAGNPAAALARLLPLGDRPGLREVEAIPVMVSLAWAHLDLGNLPEAAHLIAEAIGRLRICPVAVWLVQALRVQGLVAIRQRGWEEARTSLEEALALARSLPYPHGEGRLLQACGALAAAQGNHDEARAQMEAALAIFRRLGARPDAERVEHDLARLQEEHASGARI
jgi:tetratricopeptide (TPR) repeat protein